MKTFCGTTGSGTVLVSVRLATSITSSAGAEELEPATYAAAPSGEMAMPKGFAPAGVGIVLTGEFVAVLVTTTPPE